MSVSLASELLTSKRWLLIVLARSTALIPNDADFRSDGKNAVELVDLPGAGAVDGLETIIAAFQLWHHE
jgi:hypothetical protein